MFKKILKALFENIKYIPDGLSEIYTPVEQFLNDVFDSTVFKVLYFIPLALLKLIKIVLNWYYENFMNNELMLQSAANRVIFVYIIPAVVIIGIIILLTRNDLRGWQLLFASPIIFALFPVFAVYWIVCGISKIKNYHADNIEKKKRKLINNPPKDVKVIQDEGLKRGRLGEIILEYALKKVPGYKKILTNLYVPINENADEYTEVDAVLINKHGIFVWDAKYLLTYYLYGKRNDEIWYKSNQLYTVKIVEDMLKTGEPDNRIKTFLNPLKQNRMHVNAIQKQLRLNGLANAHMFSGVALTIMNEKDSYVECGVDEKVCDVSSVPKVMKLWAKMSKTSLSKKEIDKIYKFLSQYENPSDGIKEAHIKRLQEKYGVQSEDEIDISRVNTKIFGLRERIV